MAEIKLPWRENREKIADIKLEIGALSMSMSTGLGLIEALIKSEMQKVNDHIEDVDGRLRTLEGRYIGLEARLKELGSEET